MNGLKALLARPAVRAIARHCGETDCHLVGGTLRDVLLGLEPADLDVSVAARGREIATALASELPARFVPLGGKQFAAFRLVTPEYEIDLWDRSGTTLHQDLARRDFTVNAMALACAGGDLVDPFNGQGDLKARCLRATTTDSFTGDALRVLRLARFAAQLSSFEVEPSTVDLARASADRLSEIAAERIRVELELLFGQPTASQGFAVLTLTHVYPRLWLGPEPDIAAHTIESALDHQKKLELRVMELLDFGVSLPREALEAARLALTFLPLGQSPAAIERWRDRGYVSQRRATTIVALAQRTAPPNDEVTCRRLLFALGESWGGAFAVSGSLARNETELMAWRRSVADCRALIERERESLFAPPRWVDGGEAQTLTGIAPGPELGQALAALQSAQVDGTVRSREDALAFLGRYSAPRVSSTSKK
jgi:tRNA nucleotidyltransferase/poly(A) polymerase